MDIHLDYINIYFPFFIKIFRIKKTKFTLKKWNDNISKKIHKSNLQNCFTFSSVSRSRMKINHCYDKNFVYFFSLQLSEFKKKRCDASHFQQLMVMHSAVRCANVQFRRKCFVHRCVNERDFKFTFL